MNTSLARWLADNRETLLPHWIAQLKHGPPVAAGNGLAAHENEPQPASVPGRHPDELRLLLSSIYDGLINAAEGNYAPLNECLRLLRALRTSPGEDELPHQIGLTYHLRRAAWDLIFKDGQWPANGQEGEQWRALLEALDHLLEYTATTTAAQWITAAEVVRRELNETRLLVESLSHDAEATDRTTLHVSTLNEIAQALSANLDDQAQQLAIVGESLKSALEVSTLTIWLFDADGHRLYAARSWGDGQAAEDQGSNGVEQTEDQEAQAALLTPGWQISLDESADLIAQAFRLGEMVLDLQPNAAVQGSWYQPPRAVLAMPLVAQRTAIGVIGLQHETIEGLIDRSQQDFLKSAASQVAIALENARLYGEVRQFNAVLTQRVEERTRELQIERDMLETLYEIAVEVSSTLDRDTLLENSLTALARLVGVEHGSIMLVEADTGHLVDRAVLGAQNQLGFTRFPMGQGIVGWVAQQKKPAVVADVSQDPRWVPLPEGEVARKKLGSMIAVPLVMQHDTMGVLLLSHDDVGYFREEHLRLLTASAGQIALGIHNALLYNEIEQQLMHRGEMLRRQEEAVTQSTAILQSLSDGVIVCNAEGGVLAVNPAIERILERSMEELVLWNLPDLLKRLLGRRAIDVPVEDLLARPLNDRHEPRSFSTTFQISTRVVSVTLDPVLTSKEALMGAVAVFRDITREVESDRLKTEFIGTVSHELRTPMTSIKGFTQLLAMGSLGPVNDTQKEFLNIIQTNAERMISIINDLLDITKIETGSVELEMRSLHLAESLSNVMMELQPNILARSHEVAINIPPGLPLVRADAKRFNQILFNLVSNAIKYTPLGGKITMTSRDVGIEVVPENQQEGLKPGARYVQIDIADTGVGIPPEEHERIFDRFYRTENPLKVEAGGTGLGLSLVRPLVELFGGRIWVRSASGEGSTFSFIIPAA